MALLYEVKVTEHDTAHNSLTLRCIGVPYRLKVKTIMMKKYWKNYYIILVVAFDKNNYRLHPLLP